MKIKLIFSLFLGGCIRYFLTLSHYGREIQNQVEISTPINSHKRVQEGVFMLSKNVDPYTGDMVHEIPIILITILYLGKVTNTLIPFIYIAFDLLTATLLYFLSKSFITLKLKEQSKISQSFAIDSKELQLHVKDVEIISDLVLIAFLFNPMAILNCIALTSTVITNLLLALTLFSLCNNKLFPCLLFLSIEAMRNLYPMVLIAPILLLKAQKSFIFGLLLITLFCILCVLISLANYMITSSWDYMTGTIGFIFFFGDLQPNIGLFWYFFTEMFEHFRNMFLLTFQMNAMVLYSIPLTLKLRKEPILLVTILLALNSIFRAYPCLGDLSIYVALLPLFRRSWKFMAHNFVVFCFFVITLFMIPALWYLWIYSGSANANFYFGTTLAFSTGQIFLVTDLLFAYVKREFCLYNGQKYYIHGDNTKITLQ